MSMKLYVGGLPYSTTNEELEAYFAQIGQVVSATVIFDRETGRSKGFGFVEMDEEADGKKAIEEYNGKDFGGRNITVNEARPQENRGPRPGGGGGGGFRRSY